MSAKKSIYISKLCGIFADVVTGTKTDKSSQIGDSPALDAALPIAPDNSPGLHAPSPRSSSRAVDVPQISPKKATDTHSDESNRNIACVTTDGAFFSPAADTPLSGGGTVTADADSNMVNGITTLRNTTGGRSGRTNARKALFQTPHSVVPEWSQPPPAHQPKSVSMPAAAPARGVVFADASPLSRKFEIPSRLSGLVETFESVKLPERPESRLEEEIRSELSSDDPLDLSAVRTEVLDLRLHKTTRQERHISTQERQGSTERQNQTSESLHEALSVESPDTSAKQTAKRPPQSETNKAVWQLLQDREDLRQEVSTNCEIAKRQVTDTTAKRADRRHRPSDEPSPNQVGMQVASCVVKTREISGHSPCEDSISNLMSEAGAANKEVSTEQSTGARPEDVALSQSERNQLQECVDSVDNSNTSGSGAPRLNDQLHGDSKSGDGLVGLEYLPENDTRFSLSDQHESGPRENVKRLSCCVSVHESKQSLDTSRPEDSTATLDPIAIPASMHESPTAQHGRDNVEQCKDSGAPPAGVLSVNKSGFASADPIGVHQPVSKDMVSVFDGERGEEQQEQHINKLVANTEPAVDVSCKEQTKVVEEVKQEDNVENSVSVREVVPTKAQRACVVVPATNHECQSKQSDSQAAGESQDVIVPENGPERPEERTTGGGASPQCETAPSPPRKRRRDQFCQTDLGTEPTPTTKTAEAQTESALWPPKIMSDVACSPVRPGSSQESNCRILFCSFGKMTVSVAENNCPGPESLTDALVAATEDAVSTTFKPITLSVEKSASQELCLERTSMAKLVPGDAVVEKSAVVAVKGDMTHPSQLEETENASKESDPDRLVQLEFEPEQVMASQSPTFRKTREDKSPSSLKAKEQLYEEKPSQIVAKMDTDTGGGGDAAIIEQDYQENGNSEGNGTSESVKEILMEVQTSHSRMPSSPTEQPQADENVQRAQEEPTSIIAEEERGSVVEARSENTTRSEGHAKSEDPGERDQSQAEKTVKTPPTPSQKPSADDDLLAAERDATGQNRCVETPPPLFTQFSPPLCTSSRSPSPMKASPSSAPNPASPEAVLTAPVSAALSPFHKGSPSTSLASEHATSPSAVDSDILLTPPSSDCSPSCLSPLASAALSPSPRLDPSETGRSAAPGVAGHILENQISLTPTGTVEISAVEENNPATTLDNKETPESEAVKMEHGSSSTNNSENGANASEGNVFDEPDVRTQEPKNVGLNGSGAKHPPPGDQVKSNSRPAGTQESVESDDEILGASPASSPSLTLSLKERLTLMRAKHQKEVTSPESIQSDSQLRTSQNRGFPTMEGRTGIDFDKSPRLQEEREETSTPAKTRSGRYFEAETKAQASGTDVNNSEIVSGDPVVGNFVADPFGNRAEDSTPENRPNIKDKHEDTSNSASVVALTNTSSDSGAQSPEQKPNPLSALETDASSLVQGEILQLCSQNESQESRGVVPGSVRGLMLSAVTEKSETQTLDEDDIVRETQGTLRQKQREEKPKALSAVVPENGSSLRVVEAEGPRTHHGELIDQPKLANSPVVGPADGEDGTRPRGTVENSSEENSDTDTIEGVDVVPDSEDEDEAEYSCEVRMSVKNEHENQLCGLVEAAICPETHSEPTQPRACAEIDFTTPVALDSQKPAANENAQERDQEEKEPCIPSGNIAMNVPLLPQTFDISNTKETSAKELFPEDSSNVRTVAAVETRSCSVESVSKTLRLEMESCDGDENARNTQNITLLSQEGDDATIIQAETLNYTTEGIKKNLQDVKRPFQELPLTCDVREASCPNELDNKTPQLEDLEKTQQDLERPLQPVFKKNREDVQQIRTELKVERRLALSRSGSLNLLKKRDFKPPLQVRKIPALSHASCGGDTGNISPAAQVKPSPIDSQICTNNWQVRHKNVGENITAQIPNAEVTKQVRSLVAARTKEGSSEPSVGSFVGDTRVVVGKVHSLTDLPATIPRRAGVSRNRERKVPVAENSTKPQPVFSPGLFNSPKEQNLQVSPLAAKDLVQGKRSARERKSRASAAETKVPATGSKAARAQRLRVTGPPSPRASWSPPAAGVKSADACSPAVADQLTSPDCVSDWVAERRGAGPSKRIQFSGKTYQRSAKRQRNRAGTIGEYELVKMIALQDDYEYDVSSGSEMASPDPLMMSEHTRRMQTHSTRNVNPVALSAACGSMWSSSARPRVGTHSGRVEDCNVTQDSVSEYETADETLGDD